MASAAINNYIWNSCLLMMFKNEINVESLLLKRSNHKLKDIFV